LFTSSHNQGEREKNGTLKLALERRNTVGDAGKYNILILVIGMLHGRAEAQEAKGEQEEEGGENEYYSFQ
jgi:hypothetical protein